MLDMPGGPGFVDALRRVWDEGDAAFPIDPRLPDAARRTVVAAVRPTDVIDRHGHRSHLDEGSPVEDGDVLVVATSGSTGSPKGVVLTQAAVAASAASTSARIGVTDHDHWLACLPLSHVGGLSVVTRALLTDTPLTVLHGFDPDAVSAEAARGATLVSLVATALARIDPALFRVIVLGGSRPPADRPAHALATYGMTETGSGIVYEGRAIDGVDLRIVDGEIQVRGPMLLRCYRDGTDPKDADGWFATGDLGALTDDGVLSVSGRSGDLVITGGENVWPDTVERCLVTHPAVADIAVAGVDDAEWGQRLVAFVVPGPTAVASLEDLRDHVKQTLPAYCAPRQVVVVDRIPRTALGKVQRHLLPLSTDVDGDVASAPRSTPDTL
jgi:O-succinylbenzoic acid--CoA ligase